MNGKAGWTSGETDLYRVLAEMAASGEQGVLATVIGTRQSTPRHEGSKMIVHADGSITGSVGGGRAEAEVVARAKEVLEDGRCRRVDLDLKAGLGVCGGQMEVFLEPVLQGVPFFVVGAGHIGRALIEVGSSLPFRFTVIDDRREFLDDLAARPEVRTLAASAQELAEILEIPRTGALLLASRSHELDADYFAAVLAAEQRQQAVFPYLGILGSRRKSAQLRQRFADEPAAVERLDTVQMPVGLDVGAEMPAEIAVSILAEAMAVLKEVPLLMDEEGRPLGVRLHRERKPR